MTNSIKKALEHAVNWGHGFEGTGERPEWLTEAEVALANTNGQEETQDPESISAELLVALEKCFPHIEALMLNGGCSNDTWKLARAAIAKAKGQ